MKMQNCKSTAISLLLSKILFCILITLMLIQAMSCGSPSSLSSRGKGFFTVTFAQGNAIITGTQAPPENMMIEPGQNLVLPNRGTLPPDTPGDPGVYFLGWAKTNKPPAGIETFAKAVKRVDGAPGEAMEISADTVLFAVYVTTTSKAKDKAQKTAAIVLNKNLGMPANPDVDADTWPASYTTKVAAGQLIAPYSSVKPNRVGWIFVGWSNSLSASAQIYPHGTRFSIGEVVPGEDPVAIPPVTGDFQVYANWKQPPADELFTITYNLNGGTGSPPVFLGTAYTKTQAQPVLSIAQINASLTGSPTSSPWRPASGKAFAGWAEAEPFGTASSAGTINYVPGNLVIGMSKTLNAVWVDAATVKTIVYNFNVANSTGGFNSLQITQLNPLPGDSNFYVIGQNITLAAAPVIATASTESPWRGTFLGWTTTSTKPSSGWLAGQPYSANATIILPESPENEVTFYAQWKEADYGVVEFAANVPGGTSLVGAADAPADIKAYLDTAIILPATAISIGASPARQFYAWGESANTLPISAMRPGESITLTTKNITALDSAAPAKGTLTLYAVWAVVYAITLERENIGATGAGQYPNAPALNPAFGIAAPFSKKYVVGGPALNLTIGEFAAFEKAADTAGYTIEWGIKYGPSLSWTAINASRTSSYIPDSDTTLYVRFTGKPVVITFNKNASEFIPTIEIVPAAQWGEAIGVAIPATVKGWTNTDSGYLYGGLANVATDLMPTARAKENTKWVAQATDSYCAAKTLYVFWEGKQYAISFDGGIGATGTQALQTGIWPSPVTLPAITTFLKDGFTFSNWQSGTANIVDADIAAAGIQWKPAVYSINSTLAAKWNARAYIVTYDANGGIGAAAPSKSASTDWGSAVILASAGTMVKDGYAFGGWATTAAGSAVPGPTWTPQGTYSSAFTMYALWTVKRYTVAFSLGQAPGAIPGSTTEVWPTPIALPTNPTWDGHLFGGWLPAGETVPIETTASTWKPAVFGAGASGKTFVLTSQWSLKTFTVNFDANGGLGTASGLPSSPINWGASVTLATAGTLAKDGYTFGGWATTADGASIAATKWTPSGTYNPTYTLFAVWTAKSYALSFSLGAGPGTAPANSTSIWPTAAALPANPTWTGHTFNGWLRAGEITQIAVNATSWKPQTYGPENSGKIFVLNAWWSGETYAIAYDFNGGVSGSTSSNPGIGTFSTAVVLSQPAPIKVGYTFVGWLPPPSSGLNAPILAGGAFNPIIYEPVYTLIAQWTPKNYRVVFDSNGGTGAASPAEISSTVWGTSITLALVGTLEKNGYTFSGWATTSAGTSLPGNLWTPANAYDANYTLYAVWTPKTYVITYNSNNGVGTADPAQSAETNWATGVTLATKGTLVRDGYNFGGWSATSDGFAITGTTWTPTGTYAASFTLYAVWTAKIYAVFFSLNGATGTAPASLSGTWPNGIILPLQNPAWSPPITDYVFKGWATNIAGTPLTGASWRPETWEASITLYAIWGAP